MKKIVLASRNQNKIEELRAILEPLDIELLAAPDFPELEEVEEDGDTLEANALKKARYVYEVTSLPSLADDTGLEVDALDGRPGVYSARFAGENVTYQQNVEKLLRLLQDWPILDDRKARFRTVIAFIENQNEHVFEGRCDGHITTDQRGSGGFGYDPVFLPDGFEQTFAELSLETKNEISHRGRAVQSFIEWIEHHLL
ncbi:MAG TPA: RdgB/HAM1 family non-canonical purine NTP pyrophosphatase [Balneolales bacterium]|nr:RdgB/HAM1 family non-canonical purine NTP pyrophosphatase [Balneolales bacterium]